MHVSRTFGAFHSTSSSSLCVSALLPALPGHVAHRAVVQIALENLALPSEPASRGPDQSQAFAEPQERPVSYVAFAIARPLPGLDQSELASSMRSWASALEFLSLG